jgi:hypothetical protein
MITQHLHHKTVITGVKAVSFGFQFGRVRANMCYLCGCHGVVFPLRLRTLCVVGSPPKYADGTILHKTGVFH